MRPFEGLKVVELATVLAGPEVGRFFAELGATVVKYEPPGGDVTRGWRLSNEDRTSSISAYFASVNSRKTYDSLDLKSESGLNALQNVLADADLLITNFKPSDEESFGLSSGELRMNFPQLIWGRVRGFHSDPDRPAFDVVLQAETGWMSMTGYPGELPAKLPVAMVDVIAAHQLKEALLIALYERMKTGSGSHWEITLEEASLSALANQATNFWMNGHVAQPMGTAHPNIAPYGDLLPTLDGKWAVPAIGSQTQFVNLCKILGKPELAQDIRFRSNVDRVSHRHALIEELARLTSSFGADELSAGCTAQKVPLGIIRNLEEVLTSPTADQAATDENMDGRPARRVKSFVARRL